MQDAFIVSEPKRYFKREREMQIFLFESNIVFTKREEISPKRIRYVYKDSMLVFNLKTTFIFKFFYYIIYSFANYMLLNILKGITLNLD